MDAVVASAFVSAGPGRVVVEEAGLPTRGAALVVGDPEEATASAEDHRHGRSHLQEPQKGEPSDPPSWSFSK